MYVTARRFDGYREIVSPLTEEIVLSLALLCNSDQWPAFLSLSNISHLERRMIIYTAPLADGNFDKARAGGGGGEGGRVRVKDGGGGGGEPTCSKICRHGNFLSHSITVNRATFVSESPPKGNCRIKLAVQNVCFVCMS